MDIQKFAPEFLKGKSGSTPVPAGIKESVKVFGIGILALLALGLFTTSRQLNAG